MSRGVSYRSHSAGLRDDLQVVGLASAGHFASHYFILLLPPLFPAVKAELGVTYTELGLAIAIFNIVSALLQTPAGILTDRVGAVTVLIAGLLCSGMAFALRSEERRVGKEC